MAPDRSRRAPAAGLAILSAATALGLTRVFAGSSWLVAAIVAALLPHLLVGAAAERRRPGIGAILALAAGFVFAGVVAESHTTNHGVPTGATIDTLSGDLGNAPEILRTAITPVLPAGGPLLLALLALSATATIAAWTFYRLEAEFVAITPSLVLFVAFAILGEGPYAVTTVAYALAVACFLLLVEQTAGSARPARFHAKRMRRSRVLVGGAAGAVLAVVVAALLGPELPGARAAAIVDVTDWGDKGTEKYETVPPLVDIRARLVDRSETELFTVRSPEESYWRLTALDEFTGRWWVLSDTAEDAGGEIDADAKSDVTTRLVGQEFAIGPLTERWLPAAYRATSIDLDGARVLPRTVTLITEHTDARGETYHVESEVATPTRAELAASEAVDPTEWARYLALPEDFPQDIRDLAGFVTADGAGPYAQAIALQDYFRDPANFSYSLEVESGHSEDAMREFLFTTKQGYCEQFAGTFAAMARALGLPARVAVGFTAGEIGADGAYHVRATDAHAWPEVYLDGIGWRAFEPTPGRYEPTPGDPTGTGAERPADQTPPSGGPVTTAPPFTVSPTPPDRPLPTDARVELEVPSDASAANDDGGSYLADWWPKLLFAVLLVAALGLLALVVTALATVVARAVRRRRRRHASDTRDAVDGAWCEALECLGDAGIVRRPSATPVEFALRQAPAQGVGSAGPALMDLARLQTAALYAPEAPSTADATRAWDDLTRIEAELRTVQPHGRRRWRRFRPRPR